MAPTSNLVYLEKNIKLYGFKCTRELTLSSNLPPHVYHKQIQQLTNNTTHFSRPAVRQNDREERSLISRPCMLIGYIRGNHKQTQVKINHAVCTWKSNERGEKGWQGKQTHNCIALITCRTNLASTNLLAKVEDSTFTKFTFGKIEC